MPWELDQRLKCTIHEANMNLIDGHHREWFVDSLLPHLRVALSQQKIKMQAKDLEIAMRLHETPMQDPNLGVQQIHIQLKNLCLEMQSLEQDKTVRPEMHEVWCLKCKTQGHEKDHCLVFENHIAAGGPMPLRPKFQAVPCAGPALWCTICQVVGKHARDNCHFLQNFVQTLQKLFCNFCRLVEHDENDFKSYELMMDRTPTYRVQEKMQPPHQNAGMAWT